MLWDFFEKNLNQNTAPFAAIAVFVLVVGVSLWLTPRLARWIDGRKQQDRGFYAGMLQQPAEETDKE